MKVKKFVFGLTLGLFVLSFMLSSAAWAVSPNGDYGVDYAPQDDAGAEGQLLGDVEGISPNALGNSEAFYMPKNNEAGQIDGPFEEIWNKAAVEGGTVTLLKDITAVDGSFGEGKGFEYGAVLVPQGVSITLDLNGNTLNRNLNLDSNVSSWQGTNQVIRINGLLTLQDTNASGTGKITGGSAGAVLVSRGESLPWSLA